MIFGSTALRCTRKSRTKAILTLFTAVGLTRDERNWGETETTAVGRTQRREKREEEDGYGSHMGTGNKERETDP
jgi:hypothetical protein